MYLLLLVAAVHPAAQHQQALMQSCRIEIRVTLLFVLSAGMRRPLWLRWCTMNAAVPEIQLQQRYCLSSQDALLHVPAVWLVFIRDIRFNLVDGAFCTGARWQGGPWCNQIRAACK
jgi:hypothetical protein